MTLSFARVSISRHSAAAFTAQQPRASLLLTSFAFHHRSSDCSISTAMAPFRRKKCSFSGRCLAATHYVQARCEAIAITTMLVAGATHRGCTKKGRPRWLTRHRMECRKECQASTPTLPKGLGNFLFSRVVKPSHVYSHRSNFTSPSRHQLIYLHSFLHTFFLRQAHRKN